MRSKTKAPFTSLTGSPAPRLGCVLALATAILLIALSAGASADISFCPPGSGAGQCEGPQGPQGVAVDPSNGHLYVADKGNNRVDVFDSAGSFLFAFGWGVADGSSAESQTCTTTCFAGLAGGGGGEFSGLSRIAVAPASPHDVYTFEQFRVQRFSSSGQFIAAWGGGVISGGASGEGDLSSGSPTVTNIVTTKKTFAPGQAISGAGIPAGARIVAVGPGTITLSKAATASGTSVALTAPAGAGHVAVNEKQVFTISEPTGEFGIRFETPAPSESKSETDRFPGNISAGGLQARLEEMTNIDPGDVSVSGPSGGPYVIEFKGRYADTDVRQMGSYGFPGTSLTTAQSGASAAAVCTLAGDCATGVESGGEGQFSLASDPVAVGPGGVYVGDSVRIGSENDTFAARIEKFDSSGGFVENIALPGNKRVESIAVDSGGNIYASRGLESVEKLDPSGTPLFALALDNAGVIAVDSSDDLFAFHHDGGSLAIAEFNPSGSILRRFGYGAIKENLGGIAPYSSAQGDIFASEPINFGAEATSGRIHYLSIPPAGPLACCVQAAPGNTTATIEGGINPEGKAATYHLDYITEADFLANGNSFSGAHPAVSTPESGPVGSDLTLHGIEAQIGCAVPQVPPQASCLKPATAYRYRLVAKNQDGESSSEGTFETKPPFEILATYATEIGTDAAVLHASVNPLGIPTTGYFEYVDDAGYQADLGEGHDGFSTAIKVPDMDAGSPPRDFGAGQEPKAASAVLTSLTPGTTYHYRVVVADPFLSEAGPARVLNVFALPRSPANRCPNQAFRVGSSANLPDCRAYEMVSPVEKNGTDIKVVFSGLSFLARMEQSSADGNRFSYSSVAAFGDAASAPWTSQYLASRKEGEGWATHAISPPRISTSTALIQVKFDVQYKLFTDDLSSGWLVHDTTPQLDACAPADFLNLYRRDNNTESYEALTSVEPSNATPQKYQPELQNVTADGTHAVFRANGKLTDDASGAKGADGPIYQLYEHIEGEGCGTLRLVSVLPNGNASSIPSAAGSNNGANGEFREQMVTHIVSADGSRVFWSTTPTNNLGPLYVRLHADQEQSALVAGKCSEPDKACTVQISAVAAQYWTAAEDGSTAIYAIGEKLYEFDVTNQSSTLIADGVPGMVAASEDASRVYFVSKQALGGEGQAGQPNLFLYERGGSTRLVATLFGGDETLPHGDLSDSYAKLGLALGRPKKIANGVRVTADGSRLAFVSAGDLTGYDNKDSASGRPALEVYLYDVASGKVTCVSCNPSGTRPTGRRFVGGSPPSTAYVSAQMAPAETQVFAPRALSADGKKLFFESFEALLAGDTNGKEDVYEWQQASGQKECEEVGAELYVSSAGGCLSLISSGQSTSDSELADASPDGSDVFIRTAESLLPQDPGLIDIYDVRENGGLPQPPALPPACEGEACQGPLAPPNDPTPASAAFEGAGNVNEGAKARCAKGKALRHGRCVAKQHKRAKRANHKRRAGR